MCRTRYTFGVIERLIEPEPVAVYTCWCGRRFSSVIGARGHQSKVHAGRNGCRVPGEYWRKVAAFRTAHGLRSWS